MYTIYYLMLIVEGVVEVSTILEFKFEVIEAVLVQTKGRNCSQDGVTSLEGVK